MSQNKIDFKWDGHSSCLSIMYSSDDRYVLGSRRFDMGEGAGKDESVVVIFHSPHDPDSKEIGGVIMKEPRKNDTPLWRGLTAEEYVGPRVNNLTATR